MASFTPEQVAAIEARGRVIVSASAGSGKTTVMIERIIQLILSGVGVDEILAVTFTKKAAAQMKEKLSNALIKKINDENTTADEREYLKNQLAKVNGADISTIDSFCARVLRSYFYVTDVDNAFRVIDSADADTITLPRASIAACCSGVKFAISVNPPLHYERTAQFPPPFSGQPTFPCAHSFRPF